MLAELIRPAPRDMGDRSRSNSAPRPFTLSDIGDPTKFWALVDIRGQNECWPWIGSKSRFGHGHIMRSRGGKSRKLFSHRVAFMLSTDSVIPDKVYILHECDNPSCCNPAHLTAGTQKENMAGASARGRLKRTVFIEYSYKKVVTPDGIFDTVYDAAKFYNRHPRNIGWRCRNNKFGFSYHDTEMTVRMPTCSKS